MSLSSLGEVLRLSAVVLSEVMRGRSLTTAFVSVSIPDFLLSAVRATSYDVVRSLNYVMAAFSHCLDSTNNKLDPFFHSLMLVAFSKLETNQHCSYAIVDQTVNVVKKSKYRHLSGFANAVLRRYLRERDVLREALSKDDSLRYCLPDWWCQLLKKQYPDFWQELAKELLCHPPMSLRVNRRKVPLSEYVDILNKMHIDHSVIDQYSIILDRPCPQKDLPHYDDGYVSVQDYGAQKITSFINLNKGDHLLDACCGSGGKLCAVLESFDGLDVVAVDNDCVRLSRLREELKRLQLDATVIQADLFDLCQWWNGVPFDVIVLDVPCSGSGSVRRHICSKWHKRQEDLLNFSRIQSNMLLALWPLLKQGGQLLYVTCSLFDEENLIPLRFLVDRFTDAFVAHLPGQNGVWGVNLHPGPYSDGFFYAALTKK